MHFIALYVLTVFYNHICLLLSLYSGIPSTYNSYIDILLALTTVIVWIIHLCMLQVLYVFVYVEKLGRVGWGIPCYYKNNIGLYIFPCDRDSCYVLLNQTGMLLSNHVAGAKCNIYVTFQVVVSPTMTHNTM